MEDADAGSGQRPTKAPPPPASVAEPAAAVTSPAMANARCPTEASTPSVEEAIQATAAPLHSDPPAAETKMPQSSSSSQAPENSLSATPQQSLAERQHEAASLLQTLTIDRTAAAEMAALQASRAAPQLASEPAAASAAAVVVEPVPDRFPADKASEGKKASKWDIVKKKLKSGTVTVEVPLFKPAGESLGYNVTIEDGSGLRISGKIGTVKSRKGGATVQDAAAAAISVAAAEAAGERIAPVSDTSPAEDGVAILEMYDLIVAVNNDDVTGIKSMKDLKVILDKHRPDLRFSVERKQAGFQYSAREGGYVPSPPKTRPDAAPAVKAASASAADQASEGKKASKWDIVKKKLKSGVVTVEVPLFKPAGESLGYNVTIEDGSGLRISGKIGTVKSRKGGASCATLVIKSPFFWV